MYLMQQTRFKTLRNRQTVLVFILCNKQIPEKKNLQKLQSCCSIYSTQQTLENTAGRQMYCSIYPIQQTDTSNQRQSCCSIYPMQPHRNFVTFRDGLFAIVFILFKKEIPQNIQRLILLCSRHFKTLRDSFFLCSKQTFQYTQRLIFLCNKETFQNTQRLIFLCNKETFQNTQRFIFPMQKRDASKHSSWDATFVCSICFMQQTLQNYDKVAVVFILRNKRTLQNSGKVSVVLSYETDTSGHSETTKWLK